LALSAVGTVWRTQAQREREQELLFIGHEFQAAIAAYYKSNTGGSSQYPQEISDLLEDTRGPEARHHLRRLYVDPLTGAADWTILRNDTLGIAGLTASWASPAARMRCRSKRRDFPWRTPRCGRHCYCDWKSSFRPRHTSSNQSGFRPRRTDHAAQIAL